MYFFTFFFSYPGGLAVAIPGALKGYSVLYEKYGGGVSWKSLFEATIQLCLKGIKISEHLEVRLQDIQRLIKKDRLLRYVYHDSFCSVNIRRHPIIKKKQNGYSKR